MFHNIEVFNNLIDKIEAGTLHRSELSRALKNKTVNIFAVDSEGLTLLHRAAIHKQDKLFALMIRAAKKEDKKLELLNKAASDGKTALHYAVKFNAHESVTFLLKAGALRTIKDKLDFIPADYAKMDGDIQMKRMFNISEEPSEIPEVYKYYDQCGNIYFPYGYQRGAYLFPNFQEEGFAFSFDTPAEGNSMLSWP